MSNTQSTERGDLPEIRPRMVDGVGYCDIDCEQCGLPGRGIVYTCWELNEDTVLDRICPVWASRTAARLAEVEAENTMLRLTLASIGESFVAAREDDCISVEDGFVAVDGGFDRAAFNDAIRVFGDAYPDTDDQDGGVMSEPIETLNEILKDGVCDFGWEGDARCLEDPDVDEDDYCVLCRLRMHITEVSLIRKVADRDDAPLCRCGGLTERRFTAAALEAENAELREKLRPVGVHDVEEFYEDDEARER